MIRFAFVIPLVLFASAASAQQRQGHDACARDVSRFCRAVMNSGDSAVLACLQQNRARISRGCDQVLKDHGQ
jgi:cysteine rich repeat protein